MEPETVIRFHRESASGFKSQNSNRKDNYKVRDGNCYYIEIIIIRFRISDFGPPAGGRISEKVNIQHKRGKAIFVFCTIGAYFNIWGTRIFLMTR